MRPAAALALAALLAGCAIPRGRNTLDCVSADSQPAGTFEPDRLSGSWRLVLVATEGSAAGRSVSGWLRLVPPPGGALAVGGQGAAMVLIGTADIEMEQVGALRMGDTRSLDTLAPGVAVITTGPAVIVRIGSDSNRRDVMRFDGGYFALRLRSQSADAFAGTWVSGGAGPEESAGHFCAARR